MQVISERQAYQFLTGKNQRISPGKTPTPLPYLLKSQKPYNVSGGTLNRMVIMIAWIQLEHRPCAAQKAPNFRLRRFSNKDTGQRIWVLPGKQ